MISNNIYKYTTAIFLIAFVILVVVCKMYSVNLSKANVELKAATETIDILRENHNKLLEYTLKKEKEIKDIEQKYTERLKNIPKDTCGDVKPSPELLDYLRKHLNEDNM